MLNKKTLWVAMLAAVTFMGACGGGDAPAPEPTEAPQPQASAAGGSGSISGVIAYSNGAENAVIDMAADPVCQSMHTEEAHTEAIVTDGSGHLGNVFVYVKEGAAGGHAAPGASHTLDQLGCQYGPHVSGMMVGQTLVIRNSDATLHNVHAMPTINDEFNTGQPFQGMEFEHTFDKAEVMVRFKCDVHPWMSSYVGVLDHPFFGVSAADGSYSIADLPAGEYTLEAWHEELGTRTATVTVGDGEAVEVAFDFSPEDAAPAG